MRIDGDVARTPEGIHDILRVGADDVHALGLSFAVGFDAQFDGHVEEVEILLDLADGAKALVIAEAIDGVFVGESGRAGPIEPLGEERRELLPRIALRRPSSKSLVRTGLSAYCERTPRRIFLKFSSPTSQRSMWKTMAPFFKVMD